MKEVNSKKRKSTDNNDNRPKQVYIVEHEYTCSHLYDNETTVDQKGCFFDIRNAIERAVDVIADELHVDLYDDEELMKFNSDKVDLNDPAQRLDLLYDLLLLGGVTEEIETEGVDEHTVSINAVTVEDA